MEQLYLNDIIERVAVEKTEAAISVSSAEEGKRIVRSIVRRKKTVARKARDEGLCQPESVYNVSAFYDPDESKVVVYQPIVNVEFK